ncbi:MAG: DNA integrity scanning protein DisA nucleotide-binding domain protein [Anaerolineae bacterium]|nr:DNA integrity scanning protein DisA nucleotide-binding domain protein [Anaerolineae bacterium]
MRADFTVEGFGAEILLDKARRVTVYAPDDEDTRGMTVMDSEQFGMRHRSAIRLCGSVPDVAVIVVSQDGGVSLVWNQDGKACFKTGISISHSGMLIG